MLFIRDNIPFRLLRHGNLPSNTEVFFIEILSRKKKWLMCCGYNPNNILKKILTKSLINKCTHHIVKVLDFFIVNYDNFLIVGDLNSEITEISMHEFCNSYNLQSLCHKFTCYKKQCVTDHPSLSVRPFAQLLYFFYILLNDLAFFILRRTDVF